MIKKIAVVFAALLLLSACSSGTGSGGYREDNNHLLQFEREVGDRVFFALNSSDLSQKDMATLARQAEWLKTHNKFSITVEGHCDERGTREYNIALGERRAEAVRRYLVNMGIDAERIGTISYGKERPAVIGNDEAAWQQNRRAVTAIR